MVVSIPFDPNPVAVALDFHETPEEELRAYFARFVDLVPVRIRSLQQRVSASKKARCQLDLSRESLGPLGAWLIANTTWRPRAHLEHSLASHKYKHALPDIVLTDETISISTDVAMYFGECLVSASGGLRWDLILGDRRNLDYGQPAVVGFPVRVVANPVSIVRNVSYAATKGRARSDRLMEVFDYWIGLMAK